MLPTENLTGYVDGGRTISLDSNVSTCPESVQWCRFLEPVQIALNGPMYNISFSENKRFMAYFVTGFIADDNAAVKCIESK